jgi:hypothetical protein
MRTLALAISLNLISLSSFASDSERITQLEKEVQELKLRLTNIEPTKGPANSQQKPVKSGEGWAFLANWRSLKTGMSYDEVRTTLGEPPRIVGGEIAFWYYPNRASVTFHSHQLYSWTEPR